MSPRDSEYEDESIPHIDMTSKAPVWEPSQVSFADQEDVMTYFRGEVISNKIFSSGQRIINSLSTGEEYAVYFTDDENLSDVLNAKVNAVRVVVSKGKHGVNSNYLSQKWLISP